MTPGQFYTELSLLFPRMRLGEKQETAFCNAIRDFHLDMDLLVRVAEHCEKAFPSIADISKHAAKVRADEKPWMRPHTWRKTDCEYCQGEGRIALFGLMVYGVDGGMDEFHVRTVAGYSSGDCVEYRTEDAGRSVEMLGRCKCPAGDAVTIGALPRWDGRERVPRRGVVTR